MEMVVFTRTVKVTLQPHNCRWFISNSTGLFCICYDHNNPYYPLLNLI
uniref:Uncharacterized protein n=1 Tax=Anguilla anguilla TaxID=7936 RepID=A0A0E9W432_ANGAN